MTYISGTSGINTAFLVTNYSNTSGSSHSQQKASPALPSATDQVTISAAAKTASDLEQYALPKWLESYTPPLNLVNSPLAMQPGGEWSKQREALQPELKQYGEYSNSAYQAAMKAVGATDGKSYYDIVAKDPSAADRAASVFKETLLNMPGISFLMNRLDVPGIKES